MLSRAVWVFVQDIKSPNVLLAADMTAKIADVSPACLLLVLVSLMARTCMASCSRLSAKETGEPESYGNWESV